MRTKSIRPETRAADGHIPSPRPDDVAARLDVAVEGAQLYRLRLTPSDKVLGTFGSTRDAWPAVVAAVEGGRSSRNLVLDWQAADGATGTVSSGATLEYLARRGLGLPAEHLRHAR